MHSRACHIVPLKPTRRPVIDMDLFFIIDHQEVFLQPKQAIKALGKVFLEVETDEAGWDARVGEAGVLDNASTMSRTLGHQPS
jgi:hypothetical protein